MNSKRTLKRHRVLPVLITLTLGLAFLPARPLARDSGTLPPCADEVYDGIDVSYYQGDIDFDRVKEAGIEMVYIRSSAGSDFQDPQFDQNYQRARDAGLIIGVYHSMSANTVDEAKAEARFFIDCIRGKQIEGRLAMDYNFSSQLTTDQINENALAFLNTLIDESGKEALIYTDAYGARVTWSDEIAEMVPLWVAEYGVDEPEANGKWDCYAGFQYSDTGRVDGIDGNVDLDRFTEAMLQSDPSPISGERPEPEPSSKLIAITVVRGDTLSALAREYDTSVSALVRLNDIANPNLIYIGQRLYIRVSSETQGTEVRSYTVVRGDTLWGIARRFSTTVSRLAAINKIRNPNLIFPGEVIRLS